MEKEFKYNLGDNVWLMKDNKAIQCIIVGCWFTDFIDTVGFNRNAVERYFVSHNGERIRDSYELKNLFGSKEELIKSL